MKRQETRCGWLCGFLIGMLWFHIFLSGTEAAKNQTQPECGSEGWKRCVRHRNVRSFRNTVNLLIKTDGGKGVPLYEDNYFIWMEPTNKGLFDLEDNGTSLVVSKRGVYFVNLKLNFYIPSKQNCTENLFLTTYITKLDSSYQNWINVIRNIDTLQCVDEWFQSVTLTQAARLLKGTKLRVLMEPKNYDFLIKDERTYFSVTLL